MQKVGIEPREVSTNVLEGKTAEVHGKKSVENEVPGETLAESPQVSAFSLFVLDKLDYSLNDVPFLFSSQKHRIL